jgi:hypothetical protein
MKRDANFVGVNNQEYIVMQNNFEFEVVFQVHKNKTRRHKLFYTMEGVKLSNERDL